MHRKIVETLESAFDRLLADLAWLRLLLRNVHCASYEAFLQSSLLGAINEKPAGPGGLWCDRERHVKIRDQELAPDLWFMDADPDTWSQWVRGRLLPKRRRYQVLLPMARGIVELKVAWTRGWATGSATPEAKAVIVADAIHALNVKKLRRKPRFVLVCVGGFAGTQSEIDAALDECCNIIRDEVARNSRTLCPIFANAGKLRLPPPATPLFVPGPAFGGVIAMLFDCRWANELQYG